MNNITKQSCIFEKKINLNVVDSVVISNVFELRGWKTQFKYGIFSSYSHENFIHVYSYPDFHFEYNLGKTKEPNEFILYDIMQSKLYIYDLSDTIRCKKTFSLEYNLEGVCNPYTKICHVKDDLYAMKFDSPDESRLELVDLNKMKLLSKEENLLRKKYNERGAYTPFDYNFSLCSNRLLLAYNYVDRLELYNISTNEIIPELIIGNDQSKIDNYDQLKYYYLSITSDKSHFYCLKSKTGTNESDLIEVYDEEANPVLCLNLHEKVESISIDDGRLLWGYVATPNNTILYCYDLNKLLSN